MADSQQNLRESSARFRRSLSKMAFRNKERVMRTIGRSEETKDEIIDHYAMLINKQQMQMQKLQRDMKAYLTALKAMSVAKKAFYSSFYEIYDNDWAGKDVVASCSQRTEMLYDDVFARFQSEVLELLQNHLTEYQKCKVCIEKRGRKLVDYDAAKRTVHSLEGVKKPDPVKVEKSKETLRQTREIYEELNNYLHQQLPSLYDSRLPVCVNIFSSICESEGIFSYEVDELRTKLNTVLSNLRTSFDNGEYHIQRMQTPLDNGLSGSSTSSTPHPTMPVSEPTVDTKNGNTVSPKTNRIVDDDPSTHEYVNLQIGEKPGSVKPVSEEEELGDHSVSRRKELPAPPYSQHMNGDTTEISPIYEEPPREETPTSFSSSHSNSTPKDIPRFPPSYLFSVQALYQYRSTDDDELTFSKGEIIYIIQHPDPEEQDDGWQMGVRKVDWDERGEVESCMGVFPENFTKKF